MSIKHTVISVLAISLIIFLTGCDDSGSSNNNNSNADGFVNIAGQWSGVYYETDTPGSIPLSATIQQDGDAVVISTTKSGAGGLLTGTIDSSGNMSLTDAFDGEGWSTFYGPATANHIKIADYLWDDELGGNSPLAVIDLNR